MTTAAGPDAISERELQGDLIAAENAEPSQLFAGVAMGAGHLARLADFDRILTA